MMHQYLRTPLLSAFCTLFVLMISSSAVIAQSSDTDHKAADQTAAPVTETFWNRRYLTGDWGGLRESTHDHGLDISMRFSQFYQNVTSGGVNSDNSGRYGLKFDTWVNMDLGKIMGWDGWIVSAHLETRAGRDVMFDAGAFTIPNGALLFPVPGDFSGTYLTHLTVTKVLAGGKAAVLAGKLQAFDLLQGFFPDNVVDYGLDGFQNGNSIMSMLSWARWLTTVQYGVAGWTYAKGMPSSGFIVAGQSNTATTWSFDGAFSDGVGIMFFHRFVWDLDKKDGYLYVGAGGSTKSFSSTDPLDWTIIPGEGLESTKNKKPKSIAFYLYQILWQEQGNRDHRTQLFSGFSISDDNPSFVDFDIFASVQMLGTFASRPGDRAGFAYHYNHMSDDFVDLVSSLPKEDLRSNTWSFELFYNYQLTPWLHLTPSIQYAQNQNRDNKAAVIPGVRLVVDF
jgi:porin